MVGGCLFVCSLVVCGSIPRENFPRLQELAALLPDLSLNFPSVTVWVDGYCVTLFEDGSVEFYCEGDLRVPYQTMRTLVGMLSRFMYERERMRNVVLP